MAETPIDTAGLRTIADTIEQNGGWHIAALHVRGAADEIERLTAFVTKLANPDFSNVSSSLGPLHAAGLCAEAEIVSKLARKVLAGEWQPPAPESRDG